MAYQIIRVAGYKNAAKGQKGFGGIQIHDQREKDVSHTNEDIDWDRVHLNYDLHNGDNKINFAEKINERIASLNLKKALRSDANVMAQIFISASPEWFRVVEENGSRDAHEDDDGDNGVDNNNTTVADQGVGKVLYEIDPKTQRKYFEDAYKWVCQRYGIENIISATVHLDEATPHMHINLIPVADNKVCYADLFTEKPQKSRGRNGGQLTALHDDFYKHNQDNGYNLDRGELQSVTGKKEHLSVLDFKKQEREKEVAELDFRKQEQEKDVRELDSRKREKEKEIKELGFIKQEKEKEVGLLDKKAEKLTFEAKNLETEIQSLESLKNHTADNVSNLRLFASELQNDINILEQEKTRLNELKTTLKQQIKTEQDILSNLNGKTKTKNGIEKIKERTFKTLLGDALKISREDFDDLIKTALSSPTIKTTSKIIKENESLKENVIRATEENEILREDNQTLKTEIKTLNETFTEKTSQTNSQLESSERKLDRAYKTIKIKDEEIADLNEQLTSQTKRADHWITQARTYEANYNRVLKERNVLGNQNKNHDHNLD